MAEKIHVTTTINDTETDFLCETRQSLLEVLRDVLGLMGSKEGCNDGNCGACTVSFDGRIVDSCLVLGVEAEGKEITTEEPRVDLRAATPGYFETLRIALRSGRLLDGRDREDAPHTMLINETLARRSDRRA